MKYPIESWRDASKFNDRESIDIMVDDSTAEELNEADSYGVTPLMVAASSRDEYAVSRLLEVGAQLEAEDEDGKIALNYAEDAEWSLEFTELVVENTFPLTEVSAGIATSSSIEDGGYDEVTDSYSVAVPVEEEGVTEAYGKALESSDKISLGSSYKDADGNTIIEMRIMGVDVFKEAKSVVTECLGLKEAKGEASTREELSVVLSGNSSDFGFTVFTAKDEAMVDLTPETGGAIITPEDGKGVYIVKRGDVEEAAYLLEDAFVPDKEVVIEEEADPEEAHPLLQAEVKNVQGGTEKVLQSAFEESLRAKIEEMKTENPEIVSATVSTLDPLEYDTREWDFSYFVS